MNRDARAQVLAALREVYDGKWIRSVGTDGARLIPWSGRVALIGAVTTAWDTAHSVISLMGERFVLLRMDSTTHRREAGRHAIGNTGSEVQMRDELSRVVAGVLATVDPSKAIDVTDEETEVLLGAADLVTLARTAVDFDYRGYVIDSHAPEMPTRFAKQLAQVVRGAVAVGLDRGEAMRLAIRCARDSMPPLRLSIIDDLAANPDSTTGDVRRRIEKPRATVDRQLQALHSLGVVEVDEVPVEVAGKPATRWLYRLTSGVDPTTLSSKSVPEMLSHAPNPQVSRTREETTERTPSPGLNKSGTAPALALCPLHGAEYKPDVCVTCEQISPPVEGVVR